MAALGVGGGHNKILSNDVSLIARPLYNLTWCTALCKSDIPTDIRK